MATHHRFIAWQQSHALALEVYAATDKWPQHERFGITAQVRRAAISIPTNIAEGAARRGSREFKRFLDISLGSLAELDYLLELARDLSYLAPEQWSSIHARCAEAGKVLWGLARQVGESA